MIRNNTEDDAEFWALVDKSGGPDACWPWQGGMRGKYGRFKGESAHRLACESKHGPLGDLNALHSCDNPPCCNPGHLFGGTQKDNVDDCIAKGRRVLVVSRGDSNGARTKPERVARGVRNANAVLTDEKVIEARRRYAAGGTYLGLAKEFGVTRTTIRKAIRGTAWAHLGEQS